MYPWVKISMRAEKCMSSIGIFLQYKNGDNNNFKVTDGILVQLKSLIRDKYTYSLSHQESLYAIHLCSHHEIEDE